VPHRSATRAAARRRSRSPRELRPRGHARSRRSGPRARRPRPQAWQATGATRVVADPVQGLLTQVERSGGDVSAPDRVVESLRQERRKRLLAGVAARAVAAVVTEGDRLGQYDVHRHAREIAVATCATSRAWVSRVRWWSREDEDLGLPSQAPECRRVQDPVPIALETVRHGSATPRRHGRRPRVTGSRQAPANAPPRPLAPPGRARRTSPQQKRPDDARSECPRRRRGYRSWSMPPPRLLAHR